ncbi:hydroxymethylglutaryl-CoA reductase, degradative [Virgibacillus dakarensis]|uniref:3-hydroxy-3-methylglutaryl coenzyme A reductase n=1 Tax=Lentibacillus populi TaxID=1827502 RepID=A0A9W5TYX1_9BACI|nr:MULTISPECIES: hydroxymethylglutaryl-CoA reductase, degradative [Bacillaceae]MBT2216378.1 hydroxymethylglutaryl-CoA reductase, degradative [Virgibacillus dakarensis]MTW86568.1 hydroxymethylglutaryl-CoA reductase, degradative [Virgibacillus dakarensis]GGB47012.1 3-hydroxy-3-methylglutaryl-CoA reductase [Lentibacillus populi]
MTSFISGFYKLTPEKRLSKLASLLKLTDDEVKIIRGEQGFTTQNADRMIENVIGYLPVPLGIAVNFKVDGKDCFVPMATEEPSVVAAASHAAKLTYHTGGFTTSYTGSIMRGQIQIINLRDPYGALARIYEHKEEIIQLCNEQDQTLVSFGGGAKDLDVQIIQGEDGQKMVVVHLLVDTKDAMGANAVNTMAEATAPLIENITGGNVVLKILSNLADQRIVRARAIFEAPFQDNQETLKKFISAHQLALVDPYRAATHNKGIMNGISAVVLATGNDTRAIEAGAHAYAAFSGRYRSLTQWELGENNSIIGTIELPLAVGLIGGATQSHPVAKLATKILQAETAERLAAIIASTGLAQNFAAIKALVSEGIQKGHMKLHARNMAAMAGANENETDQVVELATKHEKFRFDDIKRFVQLIQKQ